MTDQKLTRQVEAIQKATHAARARIEQVKSDADLFEKKGQHTAAQKKRREANDLKDELASGLEQALLDLRISASTVKGLKAAVKRI